MAEAIFTLSADITPQLDERALEQQAQQLANQLNKILAKQINKVSVNPETGNFRPFQQELDKTRGFVDKLQGTLGGIPGAVGNIAKTGRSAFLKFTDAVNVTRREFVGFGNGIRDTIRQTNLFETALDNIKATGSTISEIPTHFETLAAQVRSGTSAIDQLAAGGDRMAQLFQPIQRQGEAARTEFVELNRSVDLLTSAVNSLAGASRTTGSVIKSQFGQPLFNTQIQDMEELLKLVPEGSVAFLKLKGSIDQANNTGTREGLIQELIDIRENTASLTGPLGRIGQALGIVDKEARQTAIDLEQGVNKQLIALGAGNVLGPIERLNTHLRSARDTVVGAVKGFNEFRLTLANLLPGQSPVGKLVDSIADAATFFKVLRSEGVTTLDAIKQSASVAFQQFKDVSGISAFQTKFQSALQTVKAEITGLGLIVAQTEIGNKILTALGPVPGFIKKNLVDPFKSGLNDLKTETTRLGKEVGNGLSKGLEAAKAVVLPAVKKMATSVITNFKTLFGISSPSKVFAGFGVNLMQGLAAGISKAAGLVTGAFSAVLKGLTSLTTSAVTFAKSAATVAGVALAGLGATALHAGIEFNTLQQVVSGTLPVLVGSKQAAAGLLEEVNALNDSSPFARSAFLQLTQTLAGFGVEAKKITPLIDAIQQTVAATGGGEQDLQELGGAFARIQSQGRLSLDVLQSFSSRGVDAIGILGQAMGKTQSEIREMISNGLIPADLAIDELTKGLKEKFDGATEAVARNLPGALDRIKAKLRDMGATLTKAFVNPEGGGALVDFLNSMSDSLKHITVNILPKLAPLLQTVANAFVIIGEKVESFVKTISGDEISQLAQKFQGLLPILAAVVGFFPAMLGFIPVVGPLIAGLGGPFTALALAIGVLAVQSETFREALSGLAQNLTGVFTFLKENIGGVVAAFAGLIALIPTIVAGAAPATGALAAIGTTIGGLVAQIPILGGVVGAIGGPFTAVALVIGLLVVKSKEVRESFLNFFDAIKPVFAFVQNVAAVAIQILSGAVQALAPLVAFIINLFAAWVRSFSPLIEGVSKLLKGLKDSGAIEKVFGGIKTVVEGVINVIKGFINIYNKLPFLPNIELEMNVDTNPLKKAQKEAADLVKEQKKAAVESALAITDNYNAATKAVEVANTKMSGSIDSLKQGLQTIDQKITPLFEAAKAVKAASEAVTKARETFAEATAKALETNASLTQIYKDQARALEDVISPVNELARATRDLTRLQNGLRDMDRELIDLAKEKAALNGERAADDRAGLARSEERAQISLNKALQAQIDLENELNGANKVSINLAGLSLDQIRAKLAAARASASARGRDRKETAQEIADRKTEARLDVEDATQGVKDSKNARLEFEEEIKIKIRDIDERTLEIEADKADKKLDEENALKSINRLRAGENALAAITKDFDEKIRDAKDQQASDTKAIETASKGIQTATEGAATAALKLRLESATIRGNTQDIATAQQAIWAAQEKGLTFDIPTRNALDAQKSKVGELLKDYKAITAEVEKAAKAQAAAATLQGLSDSIAAQDKLFKELDERGLNGGSIGRINKANERTATALKTVLTSGAAINKTGPNAGQARTFSDAEANQLVTRAMNDPSGNLREVLAKIFKELGLSVPGFAAEHGYAPGELVHQGMNNGKGIMRMFEFGKEAVLPLTRATDMARVLQNPHVLPRVLEALPRWRMPAAAGISSISDAVNPVSDLSTVVRSARSSGGPANAEVYQKKAQREFAGTIGEAVKIAVKEAIAESDGLSGDDIDINVGMGATDTQRMIAREVKRQLDKRTGKW